jgi:hypothetical protein
VQILKEEELADCTFQPAINPATSAAFNESLDYRPIHERIGELQRNKIKKMNKIRDDVEASQVSDTTAQYRVLCVNTYI